MRYVSLFSGMECAWLAWHRLGWTCAAVAEVDPNACLVLAHRLNASRPKYMPDPDAEGITAEQRRDRRAAIAAVAHLPAFGTPGTLPNLGDVSQVTDDDLIALGHVDLLIGGSPCQDLSVAGKRGGLAGARSSLFHQQLRIFRALKHFCGTRWLVWENVPGAFSSRAGRDFAVVVGEMAGTRLAVPRDGWGCEGMAVGENGLVEWSVLDAQWFGVAQRRRRVFAVLDTGDWTRRAPVLLEPDGLRGDSAPRREAGQRPAPTISARTSGGGGLGTDFDLDGGLIAADVVGSLTARGARNGGQANDDVDGHRLVAFGGNDTRGPIEVSTALLAQPGSGWKGDFDSETFLVDPVADAYAFQTRIARNGRGDDGDVVSALSAQAGETGKGDSAPCVAIAFTSDGIVADPISASQAKTYTNEGEGNFRLTNCVSQPESAMAVRRLTPRECERLQGAEDDWTLVPNRHGKPMADGPRYKMLGNSFARPVITWMGEQIRRAHLESTP